MGYKAICFDLDGTLYPIKVMNDNLIKLTLRHPCLNLRYNKERRLFRAFQSSFKQDIPLRWREALIIKTGSAQEPAKGFSKDSCRDVYEKLQRFIYGPLGKMYSGLKPFPGVRATMEKIHDNGLKIGVLSDFPLFERIQDMKIDDLVDFACSSDDTGFLKPDTHCFEYLLYNLRMSPQEVLYVGDSYDKDIVGASNAGVDAVIVNVKDSEKRLRYPLAKAVFRNWNEFDSWLTANMGDN